MTKVGDKKEIQDTRILNDQSFNSMILINISVMKNSGILFSMPFSRSRPQNYLSVIHIQALFNDCTFLSGPRSFSFALGDVNLIINYYYYWILLGSNWSDLVFIN